MSITESRLKTGSLMLGTTEFACQATNVRISPEHSEDGEQVETLCGDVIAAQTTRTDTLNITAIQDFNDSAGFVAYTWTNDLQEVTFTWKPSGATGPSYTGKVQVRAVEVGGDVNTRITTEASWPCVGAVVVTPPTKVTNP